MILRFLNYIKHEIKTPLALLFRKILDEGVVPRDWKEANVIPVHKGGHRNTASNYRPISLTSQLCKVFEALVRDKVVHFLEKKKLIKGLPAIAGLLVILSNAWFPALLFRSSGAVLPLPSCRLCRIFS